MHREQVKARCIQRVKHGGSVCRGRASQKQVTEEPGHEVRSLSLPPQREGSLWERLQCWGRYKRTSSSYESKGLAWYKRSLRKQT